MPCKFEMCVIGLIVLLLIMVIMAVLAFVKTALIALPWTISATILGVLAGVLLTFWTIHESRQRTIYASLLSMVITFAAGYVLLWLVPIEAPPQHEGIEKLMELPVPTLDVIQQHFPVHLGIWSLLGGAASALGISAIQRRFGKIEQRENQLSREDDAF